jgi:SsrA-binding protein
MKSASTGIMVGPLRLEAQPSARGAEDGVNASSGFDSPPPRDYLDPTMAKTEDNPNYKVIAENRRARFDYFLQNELEVGIMLMGSEVKALRLGKGTNIADSYASVEGGELWLINGYIAPYEAGRTFGHEERRRRKLLAGRRDIARMWQAISREGMTLVPLVMYFNHRGLAKLKIAIGKGKKTQDKRETQAKRDWGRQKARLLRHG